MKQALKVGLILCGALGLVGMGLSEIGLMLRVDKLNTLLLLVAFALPVIMGVIAFVKPPLEPWQLAVSLAGFVLVVVKLRTWQALWHIADVPLGGQLMLVGGLVGTIVAILALAKPETPA